MEHQLGDTAGVVVIVCHVAAGGGHDGHVEIGRANHVTGHPQVVHLGEGDGAGVTHIGAEVQTLLEEVTQAMLGLGSRLVINLEVGLGGRAGKLGVVHRVGVHTRLQLVVDHVLVTLTLEHVLSEVRAITDNYGIVAPCAVVGGGVVLNQLVHIGFCLFHIGTGDAADTDRKLLARDAGT